MSDHGTTARYQNGCRCSQCREAQRDYQRDYRRRFGLQRQVELDRLRGRALSRLREAHYDEYHRYLAEERRSAGVKVVGYP